MSYEYGLRLRAPALACSRSRRRARGAALVEAVVVIPVFLIVLASVVFVTRAFGERVRASQRAKEAAWTAAMGGCTARTDPFDTAAAVPSDVSAAFSRAPGMETFARLLSTTQSSATGSATASGVLGGASIQVRGTAQVACNEPLVESDLAAVQELAWRSLARF